MIRKLMASSALIALTTAGAFSMAQAQTQPAQPQQPAAVEQPALDPAAPAAQQEQTTPIAQDAPTLTPDEPTIATAFIGRDVYASEGADSDNIGEVNDLIIGSDGKITHAVVGVGGFLGIGEKDVSVPFDQLQVVQDEDGDVRLIYAATREQLEAAEAFDRTAFDPEERAEEQQAAANATATDNTAATTGTGGIATAPGALPGAAVDNQNAADTAAAPATDTAAAPADQQTAATTETAANAVPSDAGFVNFSDDQIRASEIVGEELYGADNESIGEVAALVLQPEGSARAAVVDVGGFLGVGEKRVAIPFDEIQFMQEADTDQTDAAAPAPAAGTDTAAQAPAAATDTAAQPAPADQTAQTAPAATEADPEPRLMVNMTREQLEQLPAWEDPGEQQAAADQTGTAAGGNMAAAPADPNAPAATGTTAAAPADPNAPAAQTAAADQPAADAGMEYTTATQDLSTDDLIGSAVYSREDENLGEVGDVIFNQGGDIEAVVIDVGGFLGIGEKPVAVQFDALNVQKGENGDVRLMVNATQEQLEAAPSYDETADATGAPAPVQ